MAQMTVEEYRNKHKRCRTCVYAYEYPGLYVICKAKNIEVAEKLRWCRLRGMFCKVYQPKEVQEDGK